jgi:hypothetical protein
MLLHFTRSVLILATLSSTALADPRWIEARGKTCPEACDEADLRAVAAGKYGTNNNYYVCAAQAEGLRPGYNLTSSAAPRSCNVGHDSREKGLDNARCLCHSKRVMAE